MKPNYKPKQKTIKRNEMKNGEILWNKDDAPLHIV